MGLVKKVLILSTLSLLTAFYSGASSGASEKVNLDKDTGFVIDNGYKLVKANCTACHSSALVIQNRMSRDTWLETIRWMQKTQGLWPLGPNEDIILDYLAKHYSPSETGRRKNLPAHLMPAIEK